MGLLRPEAGLFYIHYFILSMSWLGPTPLISFDFELFSWGNGPFRA